MNESHIGLQCHQLPPEALSRIVALRQQSTASSEHVVEFSAVYTTIENAPHLSREGITHF